MSMMDYDESWTVDDLLDFMDWVYEWERQHGVESE